MEQELFNNVATFILKLWKMLKHEEAATIMLWNPSGKSFIIRDQVLFITKLLPMYFKHNNMGSFIRQLNLYDFHKICMDKNLELEYQHKFFQRDRPDLLKYIKRKLPQYKRVVYTKVDRNELTSLSKEMTVMKNRQEEMAKQVDLLQQENVSLLRELASLHVKLNTQNQILKKIMEVVIPFVETKSSGSKSEASLENGSRILEVHSNVARKLDGNNKNCFCNWIDHLGIDFRRVFALQDDNNLQLCAASSLHPDTRIVSSTNSSMDLLSSINQSGALDGDDRFGQNGDKGSRDALNYLDNDLSSLLDNDLLGDPLLGHSNNLDQDLKSEAETEP
ncbi:unnamed protein product [Tenebrio molitor]|jgi:hypothetical protein|nr:unnamed protein product [Tenebrio molitor]